MTPSAVSYKDVIEKLRDFLEVGSPLFPALEKKKATLSKTLAALRAQEEDLTGALMILVLGGTGVGKSTVLNAIARESELAATGEIRPTTENITFYAHAGARLDAVNRTFRQGDNLHVHKVDGLENKVLIDPPDFDSTVKKNRERLREVLEVSDLIICTATAERYIDDSLFSILAEFKDPKTFVFLLNKTDQVADVERVRKDFEGHLEAQGFAGAEVIPVSARAALERRIGRATSDDEGEFAKLEMIITKELDRARIREIKDANIHNLVEHIFKEIALCLPAGGEDAVSSWEELVGSTRLDTVSSVRDKVRRALHQSGRQITASISSLDALAFRGPFGWYLSVVERLKNLVSLRGILSSGGDLLAMTDNLSRRVKEHIDERDIESRFHRSVDIVAVALKDRGINERLYRGRLPAGAGPGVGRRIIRELTGAVESGLAKVYDRALGRSWFSFGSLLYNILPVAFVLYFAYSVVTNYIDGDGVYMKGDFILHSALIFLLILVVQHLFAARAGSARRAGTFLRTLERESMDRIELFIREQMVRPAEEATADLVKALDIFSNARSEHKQIKGGI